MFIVGCFGAILWSLYVILFYKMFWTFYIAAGCKIKPRKHFNDCTLRWICTSLLLSFGSNFSEIESTQTRNMHCVLSKRIDRRLSREDVTNTIRNDCGITKETLILHVLCSFDNKFLRKLFTKRSKSECHYIGIYITRIPNTEQFSLQTRNFSRHFL